MKGAARPLSRSLFRTAVNRVRLIAAAALLILGQVPAWAQSPEMQDILNQISGEFRRTQGERLSQNCDYTAIDVAKQALQRAGFTNMAAGPVVIGALEKSCKAALSLTGAGLAADAYSLSKCVYEYYTSGMDARGLVTCLGVEAAGVGAGKLLDWLDVDPVTGAFSGQVFDRIGDDLKAGGLDEAAARLKEGEIRQFAERMAEALTQVQRTAREKAQSESPEPIVYTGFAYGCTVTISSRFKKGQPPTRGGNSVALLVSIRDCECFGRAPTVGKAMKEGRIFVTVPVDFTPGPGGSPAWTANLARMRTTIHSVCCDGTPSRIDPPRGEEGETATGSGTGVVPGTPSQPVEPPPPPPPPYRLPTVSERCPECAPIVREIEEDQGDIESAQARIERIDQEFIGLNSEAGAQHDAIARARQAIERLRSRFRPFSGGLAGGPQTSVSLSADGAKVTTVTHPDGRVETRTERTGNPEIDAARDAIDAARRKLEEIEKRMEEARARRAAAVNEKAAAEAKLRADQARLEKCEEECRKRISQPPPAPPIGTVPGGGPVRPPAGPAGEPPKPAPPASPPASQPASPPANPFRLPLPPKPACRECRPAAERAWNAWENWDNADAAVTSIQHWLDDFEALLAGRPPIHYGATAWSRFPETSAAERAKLHRRMKDALPGAIAKLLTATEEAQEALRQLEECNRRCATGGDVTVGGVIGITGTNPFNPDNPAGTPSGAPQPPPPPGEPGQLQFSSASFGGTEGATVTVAVTRTGGASGQASIGYVASDRTAIAGSDFVATQGTLTWASGDMGAKSFTVQLIDDAAVEPTEFVELTLLNPTGARMAEPSRATIAIADNDGAAPPGSLQFSTSSHSTAEGQGNVTLTVTRTGGAGGAVSVRYITVSGTAGGSDFGPASATLAWADGDTSAKSFTVSIVDDNQVEGIETFSVQLSNPTGGATLGSPATATISIADNDTQTGACAPTGSAWQTAAGRYACSGNCDPCPSPQQVTVNDNRVTINPFHAGGAATFTGCGPTLTSDSSSLTYFGQANHRATITRSGNTFQAQITSSGGGSCAMSCFRTGP